MQIMLVSIHHFLWEKLKLEKGAVLLNYEIFNKLILIYFTMYSFILLYFMFY